MALKSANGHGTSHRAELLLELADLGLHGLSVPVACKKMLSVVLDHFEASSGMLAIGGKNEPLEIQAQVGLTFQSANGQPPAILVEARNSGLPATNPESDGLSVAIPLRRGRKVVGAFALGRQRRSTWTTEENRALVAVGAQIGRVVAHLESVSSNDDAVHRLEALIEAAEALLSTDPLPEILKRIAATVQKLLEVDQCSVMLVNERKELTLSATGGGRSIYAGRTGHPPSGGFSPHYGEVAPRREPVPVLGMVRRAGSESSPDLAASPVSQAAAAPAARRKPQSEAASLHSVPIFFHGDMIGMLVLYGVELESLSGQDVRLLEAISSLCGVAIGNAQRIEALLQTDYQLRLDDRLSTLGAIGSEIAHEIRNPLNIISLLLHSLKEERSLPLSRERDLDIIIEKIQHMDRVVTRTLELARQRPPHLEWLDVDRQIDNLLSFISHPASIQAVLIHRVGTPGGLPQLLMDRTHLDQILINLLLNALQAMPNGGILGIRTSGQTRRAAGADGPKPKRGRPRKDSLPPPTSLTISVSDTGAGIPAETQKDLFSPFSSHRPHGTGLGLFVAHKLVTLHGGMISVRSSPDAGTTFQIEFPLGPEPPHKDPNNV